MILKTPYTVYCDDCYVSDKWDAKSFALSCDFSQPFLNQLQKLILRVPKRNIYTTIGTSVNSDYQNFASSNKNCYLVFNGSYCEDVGYSRGARGCKDSYDLYFAENTEQSYDCVNVHQSYAVRYSQNTTNCLNSWFLLGCSNCQNCFGCVNLRNKQYHFFNEPLSKEDYEKRISEIVGSYKGVHEAMERFELHALRFPRRQNNNLKTVNSEGEYIFNSKNCKYCFEAMEAEDCRFGFYISAPRKPTKDSYDVVGYAYASELLLETVAVGFSYNVIGSWGCHNCRDLRYCFHMDGSENCFGCDGLKNSKYCILNKQYSEGEYRKLSAQIVEQMKRDGTYGLFFPPEMSFFAYNETLAVDEYPLSRGQAIAEEFRWEDNIPRTKGQETLGVAEIPDHIKDAPDSIVKEILKCVSCGYNYRLIEPELAFYRKMLIPIPRKCFYCRHSDRLRRRGPFKLYSRTCAKCGKVIQTTFSPERPEIVYCESCYNREVV
jgi:CxxC-x17-CxxC domain-containing protein